MTKLETKSIAIIGTGISGLSAAWLLSKKHNVTIFEKESRVGGHSNTVTVDKYKTIDNKKIMVDTGFIVFNEQNYPNLTAFFKQLQVKTEQSDMSFSASMDEGEFEYSGSGITGLLAQKKNIFKPRFWNMLLGILKFYNSCKKDMQDVKINSLTIGEYLRINNYSTTFIRDHILPVASCIWSAKNSEIEKFPIKSFVDFFSNHGLLELNRKKRPIWKTVTNGSQSYVKKIIHDFRDNLLINTCVKKLYRIENSIKLETTQGNEYKFDDVIIATHPKEALEILNDPTEDETNILSRIRYEESKAILHNDHKLMPKNKKVWSSWNYRSSTKKSYNDKVNVTYWMNNLQNIDMKFPLFLSLNPDVYPDSNLIIDEFTYEHPIFDFDAINAQKKLDSIQGIKNIWYCGAYFGFGFHEDGIQSGLYVAEKISNLKRPWKVENESGRIL